MKILQNKNISIPFINKKVGDELYQKVGPFFNATDLAGEIPKTMKELLS